MNRQEGVGASSGGRAQVRALALGVAATTVVHAAGLGSDALWRAVVEGMSGLGRHTLDGRSVPGWLGPVPGVDGLHLPNRPAALDCRSHRLAWMALQDATFVQAVRREVDRYGAQRVGLVMGTSTSGMHATEQAYARRLSDGVWPPGFSLRQSHTPDALARFSAGVLGLAGAAVSVTMACASSAMAFGVAQRWMAAGWLDAVVVAGVDSLCLTTLHGFDALQLLSDAPCRPFDLRRDGISIGEAAAFMLLTQDEAPVRFLGVGASSDAHHMTTPHPQGRGAEQAMRAALAAAALAPSDIGYVNAHGTGTPANDRAEAAALKAVFGPRGVAVSSSKAVTGHTLGACGVVEAIVTARALEHQVVPPTAHLVQPDASLQLDLPGTPRRASLSHAMSNSFGFGGSNCALIFGRAPG